MAAPRKSTRYIGLCAVCLRYIKVRKGVLVHHGFERPGWGHIVGDCFGVGYEPYETSDAGARAWAGYLKTQIVSVHQQLKDLPNIEVLYEQQWQPGRTRPRSRSPEPGRYVTVPVRKGEAEKYKWDWLYEQKERQLQAELQGLEAETKRVQKLIDDWAPRPLRTTEEAVAEKKEATQAKKSSREEARQKKIADKVEYYQKRKASIEKRLEKAQAKLAKSPGDESLKWDVRSLTRDLETLPEDAVRKLREMSGFTRGTGYGLSKEEALELLGWSTTTTATETQTRKLKNKLLR